MKWVTREKARVDRIACPWLISRFIDKQAVFLFVPAQEVMAVAERENAIPVPRWHVLECLRRRVLEAGVLYVDVEHAEVDELGALLVGDLGDCPGQGLLAGL